MFKDVIAFWVCVCIYYVTCVLYYIFIYYIALCYTLYIISFKKFQLSIILLSLIFQHWKYPERLLICWVSERSLNSSYSSVSNRIIDRRTQDKKVWKRMWQGGKGSNLRCSWGSWIADFWKEEGKHLCKFLG